MGDLDRIKNTYNHQSISELIVEKNEVISEDKSILDALDKYGSFSAIELKVGTSFSNMWDVLMYATSEEKRQIDAIVKEIISRQIEKQTKIRTELSNHLKDLKD